MIKINLGYWQNAVSGDVMRTAHKLVKQLHITLSQALKRAWKEVKEFILSISTTYKEFCFKLRINKEIVNIKVPADASNSIDYDELIENCMEHISNIKGKQFMYNVSKRLYESYDRFIELLQIKGHLTFAQDVYVSKMEGRC